MKQREITAAQKVVEAQALEELVEKYKRELFSHRNHYRGWNLKDELHKLVSGSQEVIQHIFFGGVLAELNGTERD